MGFREKLGFGGHHSNQDGPKGGSSRGPSPQPSAAPSSSKTEPKRESYGLFPLTQNSLPPNIDLDIVAVHGLIGDWEDTWTDSENMWLRDFVPKQLPNARVWSFGYNADVLTQSITDIDDVATSLVDYLHGERRSTSTQGTRILFIAHSLGGIIVKRALVLSNERSDHWNDIQSNTIGAMFFAVPHRGADAAYWARFMTDLFALTTAGAVGNKRFLKALQRNSPEFCGISKSFIQPGSKLKIIRTFYETMKMGNSVIVDKDSATLGINNELSVPIQGANHRNICKFESYESQKYRPVRNALGEIMALVVGQETKLQAMLKNLADEASIDWEVWVSAQASKSNEFDWIINMPQTESWIRSPTFSILSVEYDAPWDWHANVSHHLWSSLKVEGLRVICGLAPMECCPFQIQDWRSTIPRRFIAQLLRLFPNCREQVDKLWHNADGLSGIYFPRQYHHVQWQSILCSHNVPWQFQWALLACILACVPERIVLIIMGRDNHNYNLLDEAMHFLIPRDLGNLPRSSEGRSEHGLSKSHRILVVGGDGRHERHQATGLSCHTTHINEDEERKGCLSHLYFPELHSRRDRVERSEHGTNQWIYHHSAYRSWIDGRSSMLWISGKAGSGKSTLAAALQKAIFEREPTALLADFFYSSRAGSLAEIGHAWMLRSILYQILEQDTSLYDLYRTAFRSCLRDKCDACHTTNLETILLQISCNSSLAGDEGQLRPLLFILDGLDESEDGENDDQSRERVFGLFSRLCSTGGARSCKVLALSRPEHDIQKAINPAYQIDMRSHNEPDIKRIIHSGIDKIMYSLGSDSGQSRRSRSAHDSEGKNDEKHLCSGETDHPLGFIHQHLVNHADGVILWVVMVLRELVVVAQSGACTIAQLKATLEDIPVSLTDLYRNMLQRLLSNPRKDICQTAHSFNWFLFAGTTLKVCEIRDAIAMFGCEVGSDRIYRYLKEHRVVQFHDSWKNTWRLLDLRCSGFVEVVRHRRPSSDAMFDDHEPRPQDSVQLVHQTAKEFLLSHQDAVFLRLRENHGVESIGSVCSNYLDMALTILVSPSKADSIGTFVRILNDWPLLNFILKVFPSILDRLDRICCDKGAYFRQRLIQKLWLSYQYRHLSLAWWIFNPWIERYFVENSNEHTDVAAYVECLTEPDFKHNVLLNFDSPAAEKSVLASELHEVRKRAIQTTRASKNVVRVTNYGEVAADPIKNWTSEALYERCIDMAIEKSYSTALAVLLEISKRLLVDEGLRQTRDFHDQRPEGSTTNTHDIFFGM